MRRGASLSTASRSVQMKPGTLLKYAGGAIYQDKPGGRFRATPSDRLRRTLQVPTAEGRLTVPVTGIRAARRFSAYENAVAHFLRTGDVSKLAPFTGKRFRVGKRSIAFLTDPTMLRTLAEADLLRLDHLYASLVSPL